MGFHDHLYPSSYYNEEELLTSDEYPPPLVNICAKYCVNHLSQTLLEKIKVPSNEVIEPQIAKSRGASGSSSSPEDVDVSVDDQEGVPPPHGFVQETQYRLRPGVRLPSELSEKIFAYLPKNSTSAELFRGDGNSSSSSSSSSGTSSSSEEDNNGDDRDNLMVILGEGNGGVEEGEERALMEVQERRRIVLRQRRRRRRRRRGMILENGEFRRAPRAHHQRKKRMLWNGGIVDENGSNGVGDEEVDVFEIVGFDAIVEPLFKDPSNLPLTKLKLRTSAALTDNILATLLTHRPRELDIHECSKLTQACLQTINANSQNLQVLTIGNTTQILPTIFLLTEPQERKGILHCPKLLKLVIWNLSTNYTVYWRRLTVSFTDTLTSLDLSGCGEFQSLEFLREFRRLRSLVLYNVLISGAVDDEESREARKKKRLERLEHDDMDADDLLNASTDEDDSNPGVDDAMIGSRSSLNYVVFLKEEEGQRLIGGVAGDGEGAEGAEAVSNQLRKRLEKLVNRLVAPICSLTQLRHLDISTSSDPSTSANIHVANLIGSIPSTPWSTYPSPNQVLSAIIQHLPHLTHLDISGTNLSGRGVAVLMNQNQQQIAGENRPSSSSSPGTTEEEMAASKLCDIPGLNARVDNPLEFLGLYGTAHDASHRHCIPAKRISGDKDEAQILVACEAYIHRHDVLEKVLNDLFHLFRSEKGTHITKSLRLILRAMNLHPSEKHVQISGSASLFYIVKNEQHSQAAGGSGHSDEVINPPMKRMILSTIVNAMAIHKADSTMARNGCLTICHFRIPQDVMFLYAKLVKILLKILGQSIGPHQRHESFVERIAIYLLNSLACQVEGWHKRLVGDLGAMKRMLQLIRDRLSRQECDDVMEIAWSTMWNVTDETPENCEKFLKNDGMVLFLKCLHTFPSKPELLRNMMGLLGNVAEVGSLRQQLMTSVFISVFCKLLDSTQDNIEVSYNAAGVLAHMLSDGDSAWVITSPSRSVIQESMVRNVNRWNINSTRNINYRSFEPILRLLRNAGERECQLWAAWALANLTRVYPDKYVPLVEKEQGLGPLKDLLDEPLTPPSEPSTKIQEDVKKYARITLQNVEQFNKSGKIDLNSFMDG